MTNIQQKNELTFARLKTGDLVEFKRRYYSHWGVFIGNMTDKMLKDYKKAKEWMDSKPKGKCEELSDAVVHLVRLKDKFIESENKKVNAEVRIESFFGVANGNLAIKNNDMDKKGRFSPSQVDEILKRAFGKVGPASYDLVFHNCEHFASWCRYGIERSDQVKKAEICCLVTFEVAALATATVIMTHFIDPKKVKVEKEVGVAAVDDIDVIKDHTATQK